MDTSYPYLGLDGEEERAFMRHGLTSLPFVYRDDTLRFIVPLAPDPEKQNMVMVHGTASTGMTFCPCLSTLSRYNVHILELPGWGRSHHVPMDQHPIETIESFYVDIMRDFYETLGLSHAILLGHSFGAYLSISFARAYPERVSKLVLVSPAGLYPTLGDQGAYWGLVFRYSLTNIFRSFGTLGRFIFFTGFRLLGCGPMYYYWYDVLSDPRTWGDRVLAKMIHVSPGRVYWKRPALLRANALPCPVYLVYGERDTIMPPEQGIFARDTLGFPLYIVEGTGHNPFRLTKDLVPFIESPSEPRRRVSREEEEAWNCLNATTGSTFNVRETRRRNEAYYRDCAAIFTRTSCGSPHSVRYGAGP
jgi:pimeloyl-ACP methyl ester carboxylesterase